jgi:hypothetical protein
MLPKDAKELAEGIMQRRKASLARLAKSSTFKAMTERTSSECSVDRTNEYWWAAAVAAPICGAIILIMALSPVLNWINGYGFRWIF